MPKHPKQRKNNGCRKKIKASAKAICTVRVPSKLFDNRSKEKHKPRREETKGKGCCVGQIKLIHAMLKKREIPWATTMLTSMSRHAVRR